MNWSRLIPQLLGGNAQVREAVALGGQFDRHWRITLSDGTQLFAKSARATAADRFAAEADGLAALAACGAVRIPRCFAQGVDDEAGEAFLLLEWLELQPLAYELAEEAARAIVALHEAVAHPDRFGWHRDNYLGATPQQNGWEPNWAHFFLERRIKPQLAWAVAKGFSRAAAQRLEEALAGLPALFLEYAPRPALLHGDLWHGNIAQTPQGEVVLIDPAVHQGDHESELAMMELFGGFPPAFYAAYRRLAGLHRDYERRKPLYTLYHILNHFNLFGGGYAREAERLIARLTSR